MNIENIKVEKIKTNNARPLDKAHLKSMVDSWNDDFNRPLLALKYKDEYIIYDGHHRFEAQKELGRKSVFIQVAETSAKSKKDIVKEAFYRYSMIQSERTKSQTSDDLGLSYMLAEERNKNNIPILITKILKKSGLFVSNKTAKSKGGVSIGAPGSVDRANKIEVWEKNEDRISYNTVNQLVKMCLQRTDNEKKTIEFVGNLLSDYRDSFKIELNTKEYKLAVLKVLLDYSIDNPTTDYEICIKAIKKYCEINKCGRSFGCKLKWISKQGGQPSEKSLQSCFGSNPISMDKIKQDWYISQLKKVA